MNINEEAETIWRQIYNDEPSTKEEGVGLIVSFADAIRRECADRAVAWYNDPQDPLCEHEDDDEYWNNSLRAAILGTGPAREESRLASCPHCGTVIMENGYGAHHSASCPLIGTHFNIGTHVPAREES